MNSFIKYIPESLNDHKAFVELILGIIDTKLQFVKHRTDTLIKTHHLSSIIEDEDYPPDIYSKSSEFKEDILLNNHEEEIFSLIELYSKTTNLLLTMRTELRTSNVSRIYDLLSEDRYMLFENDELISMLKDKNTEK